MTNLCRHAVSRRSSTAIVTKSEKLWAACLCTILILFSLRTEGRRPEAAQNEAQVRFLTFNDVRETLEKYANSDLPESRITSAEEWDRWIREQDHDVRSRIDRGVEDSISNLILFGTSFTKFPRLANSGEALDNAAVKLTPAALARVHQLVAAMEAAKRNERVEFANEFLRRELISKAARVSYLAEN